MMMNQSVQYGCKQTVVAKEKRYAEQTKRYVEGRLGRRWPRCMTVDDSYRAPSLFTWGCSAVAVNRSTRQAFSAQIRAATSGANGKPVPQRKRRASHQSTPGLEPPTRDQPTGFYVEFCEHSQILDWPDDGLFRGNLRNSSGIPGHGE